MSGPPPKKRDYNSKGRRKRASETETVVASNPFDDDDDDINTNNLHQQQFQSIQSPAHGIAPPPQHPMWTGPGQHEGPPPPPNPLMYQHQQQPMYQGGYHGPPSTGPYSPPPPGALPRVQQMPHQSLSPAPNGQHQPMHHHPMHQHGHVQQQQQPPPPPPHSQMLMDPTNAMQGEPMGMFPDSQPANPYCGECRLPIYPHQIKIMCLAGCESYYHRDCSGLTPAACDMLMREMSMSNAEWACNRCISSDRRIPVVRTIHGHHNPHSHHHHHHHHQQQQHLAHHY